MRSHCNFICETNEKKTNKLLIETVNSYVEVYVLPNMEFLLNHEDAKNIKKVLTFGEAMTEEEFEDQLGEMLQDNVEPEKIKLIYKMLRRLIAEPITEVDTLGHALTNTGIRLSQKKASRLNNALRILIFDAINDKSNSIMPQMK